MTNRWGTNGNSDRLFFMGSKVTADGDCSHKIKRHLLLGRKVLTNLDSVLKQRHHFVNKGPYSQSYVFSSIHVGMWELGHKEGWGPKNWCFQTAVLEKILEGLLDSKEIKSVNPKGNQSWMFVGRTDVEVEAPILWPLMRRTDSLEDPDAVKDWRREEKGTTEDEMVWWHHRLNGHEFE